ncbi:MAG: hypothetical protein M3Z24_03295, partial [Chloroflexota bacterium]|nr:hypothetical protein [Chloroflexota bacterium]
HQAVQLVAEDRLLFGSTPAIGRTVGCPLPRAAGHQMETHDRHRQTVDHTLRVFCQVEASQHYLAQQVDGPRQGPPPTVEAGTIREVREERTHMLLVPPRKEFGFFVETTTFSDEGHSDQFTVTTGRSRAGALHQGSNLHPGIIYEYKDPQAEIGEIGYHLSGPPVWLGLVSSPQPYHIEGPSVNPAI